MTAVTTAQTMTAEEFLALPEAQHGRPWNLVEGELVMSEPTFRHGTIAARLIIAIGHWTQGGRGRGAVSVPIEVVVDERNVYAPDVLWYSEARVPGDPDVRPQPMPDLAVEVRSPSTWRYDIGAKKTGYEQEGLRELWLADTATGSVLVFRRSAQRAPTFDVALELASGDVLESPLLDGFALSVADLFAD